MGIDITLMVERRTSAGTWERVEDWVVDPYFNEEDLPLKQEEGYPACLLGPLVRERWYDGRNSMAFAVLAGVGKYGDDVIPIAQARGLPGDAANETSEALLFLECHNISWLTLRELQGYNWAAKAPPMYHLSFSTVDEEGKEIRHKQLQKIYYGPSGSFGDEVPDIKDHLLERLVKVAGPDDVRIVFGFDS